MARHVASRGFAAVREFALAAALALRQLAHRVVDVFREVILLKGTALHHPRILAGWTVASALLGLSLVSGVSAQPAPSPIPNEFCGTWSRHGSQIQIDCEKVVQPDSPYTAFASNMTIEGRTYVWCIEPGTNKRNLPPCDRMEGNNIISGYEAWLDAEPSTDPTVDALIATFITVTNQEQLGTTLTLAVEPGPILDIEPDGARYCRDDTDPAIGQLSCGA